MKSRAAGCLAVAAFGVLASLGGSSAAAAPASKPARVGARPPIDVRAAALIEATTGQPLFGANSGRQLAIASATKVMTALVTLEHARLGQVFSDPPYYLVPADSQIGLVRGERMTVHDLLIALLLPSADDAAEDLAVGVGRGSASRFVAIMNARARQLGLRHTHYSTPIGLDTPGNYSTASDLLTLTRFVLSSQPFFRRVVALPRATIRIGASTRVVRNLNGLVGRVGWVKGVKTGHTLQAGYVLIGSGTRNGMTLISAVLGAPSEAARESDTLALLEYGFARYRLLTPVRAGAVLARPPLSGYSGQRAGLVAATTFSHVFRRTMRVHVVVHAPTQLTGPLRARAAVGTAVVWAGGRRVARVPLLLRRAVPAPPSGALGGLGSGGFTLLMLGLLLIVGGLIRTRRERRRASLAARRRTA